MRSLPIHSKQEIIYIYIYIYIKSKEYLAKILGESKSKTTLFSKKIEDIKKDFSKLTHSLRHGFSKSKLNEFIRSLYNIKIQKSLPAPKIKETNKIFCEVNDDYYKPIKTKSSFNGNYIEYESKVVKDFSPREYLDIIRPHLSNMINDNKTTGEWKIQLTM